MTSKTSKTFVATLEYLRGNLGWVIVRVPFNVKKTWGSAGLFKIKGEVNGVVFRSSLFPQKTGEHFVLVNKKLQKAAGIRVGSSATFRLEPDAAPRIAFVPPELEKIFRRSKRLKAWYEKLNYSSREYIGRWIAEPKNPASRERRADQLAERMLETMEAERELPPLIRNAFAENPRAWKGWNRMTPKQRRGELLALFYYRTPESRARRLEKMIEAANLAAEKSAADDD